MAASPRPPAKFKSFTLCISLIWPAWFFRRTRPVYVQQSNIVFWRFSVLSAHRSFTCCAASVEHGGETLHHGIEQWSGVSMGNPACHVWAESIAKKKKFGSREYYSHLSASASRASTFCSSQRIRSSFAVMIALTFTKFCWRVFAWCSNAAHIISMSIGAITSMTSNTV